VILDTTSGDGDTLVFSSYISREEVVSGDRGIRDGMIHKETEATTAGARTNRSVTADHGITREGGGF
jgi:hypothetical protein